MTDPPRPNPLGLPLDPDPSPPSMDAPDAPDVQQPSHPIDDPVLWPEGEREAPGATGGSLDLPAEPPDGPIPRVGRPDPRIT